MTSAPSDRLRVFLVAHDATPPIGGPSSVGWSWARELDAHVDLTLVTHGRNRRHIEAFGQLSGRVLHVDTERLAAALDDVGGRPAGPDTAVGQSVIRTVAYASFDAEATRLAERLAQRGEIDVVHRVSPSDAFVPSRLGSVGLPFVIGPIAGSPRTARGFESLVRSERSTALMAGPLARLLDPEELTYRRAAAILIADERTRQSLPPQERRRAEIMPHRGLDVLPPVAMPPSRGSGPLRAALLGPLEVQRGGE